MPLHIYYSDKIEDLADHLKGALVAERKKSVRLLDGRRAEHEPREVASHPSVRGHARTLHGDRVPVH